MRRFTIGFVFMLAMSCFALADDVTVGAVRVQALDDNLVRIELKGPEGFEDRPTFHVVGRIWPSASLNAKPSDEGVLLQSKNYSVFVPGQGDSLVGVKVMDQSGKGVFEYKGPQSNGEFLPTRDNPKPFALYDSPRLVPPAWGATPPPDENQSYPDTSGWDTKNDSPDVYVFLPSTRPGNQTFYSDFLKLTGRTELPPLFAFGFWSSRWYPYSEPEAKAEIMGYRNRGIPLDLFVLDTNWRVGGSHGYEVAKDLFPDMKEFSDWAHDHGVKLMFNDHPEPIASALDPKELAFRWKGLDSQFQNGLDVWWYDRNWSTHLTKPMEGINPEVWGMRLYHDMTAKAHPGQRPLIMTNFQGIDNGEFHYAPDLSAHRYPIWWTGDTSSNWHFLQNAIENSIRAGETTSSPYVGDDLGGHIGPPTPELYIRYLEYGCLSPTTRVHCTFKQTRLPWDFGAQAQSIVTDYIKLRYRLLPEIYTSARENYDWGWPLLRRFNPSDPSIQTQGLSYLFGDHLFIAPHTTSAIKPPALVPATMFQGGVHAAFYDNTDLKGAPIYEEDLDKVDVSDGDANLASKLPKENFSGKFTTTLGPLPKTGDYTIAVSSDDGARLFIDGVKVLDDWGPQDSALITKTIRFEAGKTYKVELQFLQLGGGWNCHLLLAPPGEIKPNLTQTVHMPKGRWYDLWTGGAVNGGQEVNVQAPIQKCPMWVKQGSILAMAPEVTTTTGHPWKSLVAEVFASKYAPASRTRLYEDDGSSTGYQTGAFATTSIGYTWKSNKLTVSISPRSGDFKGAVSQRRWTIRVHLPKGYRLSGESAVLNGKRVHVKVIHPGASQVEIPLGGAGSADGSLGGDVLEIAGPSGSPSHSSRLVLRIRS